MVFVLILVIGSRILFFLNMEGETDQHWKKRRERVEGPGQDQSGLGDLYKKAIMERSRQHDFLSAFQSSVFLYLNRAKTYLEEFPSVSRLQRPLQYFLVRNFASRTQTNYCFYLRFSSCSSQRVFFNISAKLE